MDGEGGSSQFDDLAGFAEEEAFASQYEQQAMGTQELAAICPSCDASKAENQIYINDQDNFYEQKADGTIEKTATILPESEVEGTKITTGHALGINLTAVAGGGFSLSLGYVIDAKGNGSWFFSAAPAVGLSAGLSGFASDIKPEGPIHQFDISEYAGWGSANNYGFIGSYSEGGNSVNNNDSSYGATYTEETGGYGIGAEIGYSWTRSYTWLFGH